MWRKTNHYDKIDLLKPSYREANGYRCYTAPDLVILQQIVALKYFGFSLTTIKSILEKHSNIYAHLQVQQQVVKQQANHLQSVHEVLGKVLKKISPEKSPDWQDLITLIEEFNMNENLRKKLKESWAGKMLSEAQFEEYLFLYEQMPEEFAKRDEFIEKINQKQVGKPEGIEAESIVIFIQNFAKKMNKFFAENIKLSSSLLKSIQAGKLTQLELTPEGAHWLTSATLSYWIKRWDSLYEEIVANLNHKPEGKEGKKLAHEWRLLIEDYFAVGSKDFLTGLLLWEEFCKQDEEMKAMKAMPTPQELIKRYRTKILFNPEASSWILQALNYHV